MSGRIIIYFALGAALSVLACAEQKTFSELPIGPSAVGGGNSATTTSGSETGGGAGADAPIIEKVGCGWFEEHGCWSTARKVALEECGTGAEDPEAPMGQVSDDGLSCTFESGIIVSFDEPIAKEMKWRFSIHNNDELCMRFEYEDASPLYEKRYRLVTSLGEVWVEYSFTNTVEGFESLWSCPGQPLVRSSCSLPTGELPSFFHSSGSSGASFGFLNESASVQPLFYCH